MKSNLFTLNQAPMGSLAKVKQILAGGPKRRRLLDLGIIHDTIVMPLLKSPAGDPVAYNVRGTMIALRSEESSQIIVELVQN